MTVDEALHLQANSLNRDDLASCADILGAEVNKLRSDLSTARKALAEVSIAIAFPRPSWYIDRFDWTSWEWNHRHAIDAAQKEAA